MKTDTAKLHSIDSYDSDSYYSSLHHPHPERFFEIYLLITLHGVSFLQIVVVVSLTYSTRLI